MHQKSSLKWTLLIIEDLEFLPGKNICNVVQLITKKINLKFIVLDYIFGAGNNGLIPFLQEESRKVLKINDTLKEISKVIQFDWGDFFLFKKYPLYWDNSKEEQYPYVISQTDTTVRAVDDQYIYIYTPYNEVVDLIKSNYIIESIQTNSLDNLDYPD